MNGSMWFVLGLLCGALLGLCLRKKKSRDGAKAPKAAGRNLSQDWMETRNFLYYDGTEMPVIKENENEH